MRQETGGPSAPALWNGNRGIAVDDKSRNQFSGIAAAMRWVQSITAVGLEMALPAWLGYWLDTKWGTQPWLVIVGACVGFATGMMHLLQMVRPSRSLGERGSDRKDA